MCNFCEILQKIKDRHEYYKKPNYTDGYEAALVTRTYFEGEPSGQCTYYNYPLNYCPECGKKI